MAVNLISKVGAGTCNSCGTANNVVDRIQDYSTTRGPMVEHVVTRCPNCGSATCTTSRHRPRGSSSRSSGPRDIGSYSPPMSVS